MTAPTMRRFTVFDINPLATRMREAAARGEPEFLCGRADPAELGVVEATNAANALLSAREQWPSYPLHQLYAREAGR